MRQDQIELKEKGVLVLDGSRKPLKYIPYSQVHYVECQFVSGKYFVYLQFTMIGGFLSIECDHKQDACAYLSQIISKMEGC